MRSQINQVLRNVHKIKPTWDWAVIAIVALMYYMTSITIVSNIWHASRSNYFADLLQSFVHFHLYVNSSNHYDQSLYHNRWYLYWGPAPLLAILPFWLVRIRSDIAFTLFIGISNVVVFAKILTALGAWTGRLLDNHYRIILLLAFAFTTPNFYLSLAGRVWHTEQVINLFYILISLLFLIKYCRLWKLQDLIISIIFFTLAWTGRIVFITYGSIYIALMAYCLIGREFSKLWKIIACGAIITIIALSAIFSYNYARFHNIFETGLSYQGTNYISIKYYQSAYATFPIHDMERNIWLSFDHIPLNIPYYLFHPYIPFSSNKYTRFSLVGNSFYSVYPFIIFLPLAFLWLSRKRLLESAIILGCVTTIATGFALLLCFMSTGWGQFGNRYLFDLIPACFILIYFGINKIPKSILYSLLCYAILVNLIGAITFYANGQL